MSTGCILNREGNRIIFFHFLNLFESNDLILFCTVRYGSDSSVGIATRYVLDGPRIDSRRGGVRISAPVQTDPGAHPASCTCVPGLFLEGKTAGAWCWLPTPSIAEVKERVELYLYSLSGPSWPVLGWTLPLPLPFRNQTLVIVEPDMAVHTQCGPKILRLIKKILDTSPPF